MTKVGLCDVTVGPHLFDAMIYTVKDPSVPQQYNYAPQQRQMIHYGPPGNFQQYQPYQQSPGQQKRPPYTPTPGARPPQGYSANQSSAPRGPHTGHGTPSQQGQRSSQTPSGQPGQPAKPSPDPVIQMLATRAAADPELKALMRVVASSQASQEQLRAFQAHIDELNAIIKAREQQEKRQQAAAAASAQQQQQQQTPQSAQPATPAAQVKPPSHQSSTQPKQEPAPNTQSQGQTPVHNEPPKETTSKAPEQPQVSSTPSAPPAKQQEGATPGAGSTAQGTSAPPSQQPGSSNPSDRSKASEPVVKQEAGAQDGGKPPNATNSTPTATATPSQVPQQTPAVRPTPTPTTSQQSIPRPTPSYTPQQQPSYGAQAPIQSRPQYQGSSSLYPPKPQPPRVMYKAVVFEFTSPLTPYGSSSSGHAGSGDRYLFPEHSILEWLPSDNTLLASFIITRKVDPNTPFPIETAPEPTTVRGKGKTTKSKKGDKKGKAEEKKDTPETPAPIPGATPTPSANPAGASENAEKPDAKQEGPGTPNEGAKTEANLKEYWQPVTFRIHAADSRILEPLTRVVRPADEVRKYMNEIMDRAERAPDGFLALRLPHEDALEALEAESMAAPPAATAPARNRSSRASVVKPEEEPEQETPVAVLEEEEEDLKDFYGDPMGLPPLRV